MYNSIRYQNAENTVICATKEDGSVVVIEPTNPELWRAATSNAFGVVSAYVPPPEPTAKQKLDAEREGMRCSAAQFELALLDMGVLSDFRDQASERALIIVSRSTHVSRRGTVLAALRNIMTLAQIDTFFRTAMNTAVE